MEAAEGRKPCVLIAEDDRITAMSIARVFERDGFEVRVVADGEACVETARTLLPDVIVMDLMMPKVHGMEALKRLKGDAVTAGIGVIVCTAKGFNSEVERARELGAAGVVTKPFDRHELLALARGLIAPGGAAAAAGGRKGSEPAAGEVYSPVLDSEYGHVRLWGTRGSIPVSGPRFAQHGGNTSCMQLERGDEAILFDAGSGIREAGLALMAGGPRKVHLFMTHTHWDHIQGFPFFTPAYVPGFDITIYSARGFAKDLEQIFRGQLDQDYFPVKLEEMRANLRFQYLPEEPMEIGGVTISWEYVQHPGATVGYQIEARGKRVSYIPDNEFLKGYLGSPERLTRDHEIVGLYRPLIEFLEGIDVLIHEAQYTPAEYVKKVGWGHSSVANAAFLCKVTGAKEWVVIHHDPMHDDGALQDKLNLTRQILRGIGCGTTVRHGFDGLVEYL